MSVRLNDLIAELKATISGINATGSYVNDLSATGRVFVASGRPDGAPDLCVWIAQLAVGAEVSGMGQGGQAKWRWTVTYEINGFAPGTADTPEARITAANILYADIWIALMADRQRNNGSRALAYETVLSEMAAIDGEAAGFAGVGVCSFTATVTWAATDPS